MCEKAVIDGIYLLDVVSGASLGTCSSGFEDKTVADSNPSV